jgi:hypothetical protein
MNNQCIKFRSFGVNFIIPIRAISHISMMPGTLNIFTGTGSVHDNIFIVCPPDMSGVMQELEKAGWPIGEEERKYATNRPEV